MQWTLPIKHVKQTDYTTMCMDIWKLCNPELVLFGENDRADPDWLDVDDIQRPDDVLVSERPSLSRGYVLSCDCDFIGELLNGQCRERRDCSGSRLVRWFVCLSVDRNVEVFRVRTVPKITFANGSSPHSSIFHLIGRY